VPSASGVGTNGVLLRPPAALSLTFGEPSFAAHLAAARRHELVTAVLRLPGLGLDIDTPDDLAALGARESRTRSGRLLARLEAGGRPAAGG
jgi:2-phospho-L-lactate guanylyltransferase